MTKEEAQQFVRKAISHAMARDGSSGGVIRMVVIDKTGVSDNPEIEVYNRKYVFRCLKYHSTNKKTKFYNERRVACYRSVGLVDYFRCIANV